MKKKMYISFPISGRAEEDIKNEAEKLTEFALSIGYIPVNPLDVSKDPTATYAEHMGKDIAALLSCDAILLSNNWQQSRGCRLEKCAADIYDIKKFLYDIPLHM